MPGAWTTIGPAEGVAAACALAREAKATAHTAAATVSVTWCFMGTSWGARRPNEGLSQTGACCIIGQIRVIDITDRVYPMIKPGLTVHRLELFLAVLDNGGVGRAAQACHISQPAVSEHLRGLEAHFGVRLVERHGQRVRPTTAAHVVEPYARQALALLRTAEQAAGEVRGLRAGSLRIGASTTPATYLLPAALGRFHAAHPGIVLSLQISDTREIESWVSAGGVGLGGGCGGAHPP